MIYSEDELLMLSGIQHFYFCKRQWALIHIEQQWQENRATMEGNLIHENVDDPYFFESRNDIFISRSVPLISYQLGLYGIADAVEFVQSEKGITIDSCEGKWLPHVIEYKRGGPKPDERDEIQLAAQIISLEEMLKNKIQINYGYFFYFTIRRRVKIIISDYLRNLVNKISQEMHVLYSEQITPEAVKNKNCANCSLVHICIPRITKKKQNITNYINKYIKEEE
ncbi:MAG: CRISPR-associated protein Cas4 [Bacilli bacterium]|nr:CRISPR-associated protein Cas4 [Bacilli bacterium]